MSGEDIRPGSPLARALDDFPVPGMSADFADRVVAAAEARAPSLPPPRRRPHGRVWRIGQRFAIGAACFGALATAAAAIGVLERVGLPVPSAEKVWASLTGGESRAVAAPVDPRPSEPEMAVAGGPVTIEGPIDTPEELGEAFRRIDEVRAGRNEARRQMIDQRIAREIERRKAAGLPLPTPEEEARLRQRIDAARAQREQIVTERIEARRTELEGKVANGEALTRDDIVRPLREDQRALERRERLEQLRQMTPEQRREAFRRLPPEQRRALLEEYRARRAGAAPAASEEAAGSIAVPAPSEPAAEATVTQPQGR